MRTGKRSWVAAMLAACFVAQPLAAAACCPSVTVVDPGDPGESGDPGEPVEANLPTIGITLARRQIERQLVELGRDPIDAGRMVGQLTDEDLLVLYGNPAMMQEAGARDAQADNLILAALVVGGLFALLYTADSGIFVQD